MSTPQSWFGIDVAKAHLDVARAAIPGCRRFANTPAGWQQVLAELERAPQPMVVVEATGPYHRNLVLTLHAHAIPTAVINPAHLRYFARSQGQRAKTDPIDAA